MSESSTYRPAEPPSFFRPSSQQRFQRQTPRISDAPLYGGTGINDVKYPNELEKENAQLMPIVANQWVVLTKNDLSPTNLRRYKNHLSKRILPAFADKLDLSWQALCTIPTGVERSSRYSRSMSRRRDS